MTPKILAAVAAACAIAGGVAARSAAEAPGPSVAADPFAQALAARAVADFARRHADPIAMLTAARLLQEIPFSGSSGGDADFTTEGLFDEARRFAKRDQPLLMQISVAQSNGSRGVSASGFGKGLVRSVQTVAARQEYQFTVQAKGSEPLRVGAIGDIGTALAMRIRDGAARTVCLDDNGDYGPVCQITPKTATTYKIDIVNKSTVNSRVVILSN